MLLKYVNSDCDRNGLGDWFGMSTLAYKRFPRTGVQPDLTSNRPFLSCRKPHNESEAKGKVFVMKISFHSYANQYSTLTFLLNCPLGNQVSIFLLPGVFFGCPKNRRLASLAVYLGKLRSVNLAAWSLGTVNLPTFSAG